MQALLEAFDASNVTSGMLWSLIQGWCGDVAAALAAHATDVETSVQLAANAAAGKWSAVVSARKQHQWTLGACRFACRRTDAAFVGADTAIIALLQTAGRPPGKTACCERHGWVDSVYIKRRSSV